MHVHINWYTDGHTDGHTESQMDIPKATPNDIPMNIYYGHTDGQNNLNTSYVIIDYRRTRKS